MEKIIIYSVLPRLWANWSKKPAQINGSLKENGSGKLRDFDAQALDYIKSLGCTHIWFIGLLEHATTEAWADCPADPQELVKGRAGSPYAVRDYYDVAPYLAHDPKQRMSELEALLERVHQAGLKVLMDFIPNHVARAYHSDAKPKGVLDLGEGDNSQVHFSPNNCFYYFPDQALHLPQGGSYEEHPAKATGNDCFSPYPSANDWYETIKLNYGVDYLGDGKLHADPIPTTWLRMLEILRFWADKGVDGFRCDMAELVPEAFWAWAIPQLKAQHSLCFLAEIYQPHHYAGYLKAGFDYLYDKVGVYDTLRAIVRGECSASAFDPTRDAVGGFQDRMCYFLENHDEQRLASDFFAGTPQASYPALPALALSGKNPYLLYFAEELGERGMEQEGFSGRDGRTSIFDFWRLDSLQRLGKDYKGKQLSSEEQALLSYHQRILNLCHRYKALGSGGYHGLNYLQQPSSYNQDRLLSYVRYAEGEVILVVCNFAQHKLKAELRLPEELFSTLGLQPNIALSCEDLLHDKQWVATLSPWASLPISLEEQSALILRYSPLH